MAPTIWWSRPPVPAGQSTEHTLGGIWATPISITVRQQVCGSLRTHHARQLHMSPLYNLTEQAQSKSQSGRKWTYY